jgi:hypothetical protein
MYRKEPNNWLALTGGLSYLFSAYVASKFGSSSAVISSLGLALTSIWFHTTRDDTSFWTDQAFIGAFGIMSIKEAWERGPIELGMVINGILNAALFFYVGQMGNCYTYSPEVEIATAYHASIHMGSAVLVSSVLAGSIVLLIGGFQ